MTRKRVRKTKEQLKEMATCYEDGECKNTGNEDKCVECERNWDNWPDFNDNFEIKGDA